MGPAQRAGTKAQARQIASCREVFVRQVNDTGLAEFRSSANSGFTEQLVERVLASGRVAGDALRGELLLDVVAIEAPRRRRAAEAAPSILADTAVLQRAAVVELHLQQPGATVVADGTQFSRVDLLHFHGGVLKLFRC